MVYHNAQICFMWYHSLFSVSPVSCGSFFFFIAQLTLLVDIFCQAYYNSSDNVFLLELMLGELNSILFLVIFSRLDPQRKFIMDFRKASVAQSLDQVTF